MRDPDTDHPKLAKSQPCQIARKKGAPASAAIENDIGVYVLVHFNVTEHASIKMTAHVANDQLRTRL
jgi:hypothetical protein